MFLIQFQKNQKKNKIKNTLKSPTKPVDSAAEVPQKANFIDGYFKFRSGLSKGNLSATAWFSIVNMIHDSMASPIAS